MEGWFVRRCNVVRVLPNRDQQKTLSVVGDRCAALWNAVQYRCRQAFFGREALPSYERLCEEFLEHPAYRALPSDIGQEMIKKARSAWNSFFALRRKHAQGLIQNAPGIPRYWKDRKTGKRLAKCIPVKSPRSYAIDARIAREGAVGRGGKKDIPQVEDAVSESSQENGACRPGSGCRDFPCP